MARPKNAVPSTLLNVAIPEDIRGRLDLHLFSELEGRVPHGAYSRFIVDQLKGFFSDKRIDLALYVPGVPNGTLVRGSPEVVALLEEILDRRNQHV